MSLSKRVPTRDASALRDAAETPGKNPGQKHDHHQCVGFNALIEGWGVCK
jgi:hypothetical protein